MTRHQARHRPTGPGARLHQEVDEAVRTLEHVADDDHRTIRLVNDRLRGALAYTAARGETCQIASAAAAVRAAEGHLDGAHPDQARAALLAALQCLSETANSSRAVPPRRSVVPHGRRGSAGPPAPITPA